MRKGGHGSHHILWANFLLTPLFSVGSSLCPGLLSTQLGSFSSQNKCYSAFSLGGGSGEQEHRVETGRRPGDSVAGSPWFAGDHLGFRIGSPTSWETFQVQANRTAGCPDVRWSCCPYVNFPPILSSFPSYPPAFR